MDSQFSNLSSSNDDRQILCYRPFFYQLQNEITDDSKEEISKEYNDDFNELLSTFFLLYLLAFLVDLKKRIFQKTE